MAATDLERLVVQIEANSSKLTKDLAKLTGDVNSAMGKVEKRTSAMSQSVTAGFGKFGIAIGSFFSARAVIAFIGRVSEAADKLQALSDRTGVGTDQLQRLAGAAAQANVDATNLNDALDIFARNIGRAAEGSGDLAKIMKDLGINAGDDLVSTLLDISDSVQKAKTRTEEYRITEAAFGRSSGELVGFLRQGRDAIKEQMAAFNGGITPEAVRRLAEFNQHWQEISVSFTNMAAGHASRVLKGLSDFLHDLEAGGWRAGAQDLISILSGGLLAGRAEIVSAEVEKYRALVADISSLRKQLAAEQGPAMFPADRILRDSLADQIAAKEAELAALGREIASRKVPLVPGTVAPKPFGGPTDAPKTLTELLGEPTEGLKRLQDTLDKARELEKQFVSDQHLLGKETRDRTSADTEAFHDEQIADHKAYVAEIEAITDAADLRAADKRQAKMDKEAEDAETLGERRIDALRETFANLASLTQTGNENLIAIGKAAAIVVATIDGIQAVQKALASAPPPLNFALAASVGVLTAVNVAKIAAMAKGGIVGPDGEMPLRRYRSGGIARGRQFAEFGEGDVPEAFVPLQDGRSIPVTLRMPSIPPGSNSQSMSNVFHIDARGAQRGAAAEFEKMLDAWAARVSGSVFKNISRRLPDMMTTAQKLKR